MVKEAHTVNGRFYGIFYTLPSGKRLYLAHRSPSQVYRERMAWCIDESTLIRCRDRGVEAVGVTLRVRGKVHVYLTALEDFYGPHSFSHFGDTLQRGLPLKRFRINPLSRYETIERIAKLPGR